MTGTAPVIDFMFADFHLDAGRRDRHQLAKMQYMTMGAQMPILLRGCIAAATLPPQHHSGNHYPLYAHFSRPARGGALDPVRRERTLHHALRSDDPVLFLEHRELMNSKGGAGSPYEILLARRR